MRAHLHKAGRPLAAAAALAAVAVLAACGRGSEPDLVNGKTLYVQKCGACHVLNRAGTKGIQGPNLDEAFDAAIRDGFNRQTVAGVVRKQIANVRRTSRMPEDLVVDDDARDVAEYVALVAGKGGQDQGQLAQAGKPKVSNKPVAAKGGSLQIDADPSGALAFTAKRATSPSGALELVMDNPASIEHNIAVRGGGLDKKGNVVPKGGTSRVAVSLKPGKYQFYCSVPGHEEGGMDGELTVK